jgi:hypothetical protein
MEYVKALHKGNITISMAGNSLENPYAERLNGIIKNDYLRYFDTSTFAKLCKALDKAVWLYNNEKSYSELDYLSSVNFEKMLLQLNINERKTILLHDFRKVPVTGINTASPLDATSGG